MGGCVSATDIGGSDGSTADVGIGDTTADGETTEGGDEMGPDPALVAGVDLNALCCGYQTDSTTYIEGNLPAAYRVDLEGLNDSELAYEPEVHRIDVTVEGDTDAFEVTTDGTRIEAVANGESGSITVSATVETDEVSLSSETVRIQNGHPDGELDTALGYRTVSRLETPNGERISTTKLRIDANGHYPRSPYSTTVHVDTRVKIGVSLRVGFQTDNPATWDDWSAYTVTNFPEFVDERIEMSLNGGPATFEDDRLVRFEGTGTSTLQIEVPTLNLEQTAELEASSGRSAEVLGTLGRDQYSGSWEFESLSKMPAGELETTSIPSNPTARVDTGEVELEAGADEKRYLVTYHPEESIRPLDELAKIAGGPRGYRRIVAVEESKVETAGDAVEVTVEEGAARVAYQRPGAIPTIYEAAGLAVPVIYEAVVDSTDAWSLETSPMSLDVSSSEQSSGCQSVSLTLSGPSREESEITWPQLAGARCGVSGRADTNAECEVSADGIEVCRTAEWPEAADNVDFFFEYAGVSVDVPVRVN
jgi:hypothetical protein